MKHYVVVGIGIPDDPYCDNVILFHKTTPLVILSELSESKDLRTDWTPNVIQMRRSLDSISFRSG